MILVRNTQGLLSLAGVAQKSGKNITESDLGWIRKGVCLFDKKGTIQYCGTLEKLPHAFIKQITREIDGNKGTLLPGFVECHTHTLFTGSRASEMELKHQGLSYQEIATRGGGIMSTVNSVRTSSANEIINHSLPAILNFIKQGVTTLEIKTGYGLDEKTELKLLKILARLKKELPIRIVGTFLGAHAKPPDTKDWATHLKNMQKMLPKVKSFCHRVDIFIESGFCSAAEAEPYLQSAKELGFDITIHADQLSHSGGSQLGIKLGANSIDHIVHIQAADILNLSQAATVAVLLPIPDLFLKLPYPPARQLLDKGACVALSTDYNPGTSPSSNLSLAASLARIEMKMSLPEVIAGLTYNAAKALGLNHQIGSLEVNKTADFILLEQDWRDLFYSPDPITVKQSYSRGQALVD